MQAGRADAALQAKGGNGRKHSALHLRSPRDDVRAEAHHERADERADLLGGPLPPTLLFIQAFLAYTAKAHRYHYLPRRHDHRHADIMKQSVEKACGMDKRNAVNCALLLLKLEEISHCTDVIMQIRAIQSLIV